MMTGVSPATTINGRYLFSMMNQGLEWLFVLRAQSFQVDGLKMNDFTKEELILILALFKGAHSVSLDGQELRADKIQSMIDTYHDVYHLPKNPKVGDEIIIHTSDKEWIIYE